MEVLLVMGVKMKEVEEVFEAMVVKVEAEVVMSNM
jgi:hypothetical protein